MAMEGPTRIGHPSCDESLFEGDRTEQQPVLPRTMARSERFNEPDNSLRAGYGTHLTGSLCAGLMAFDVLGIGLLACDEAGHLLSANRTANEILKDQDGLTLNSTGGLMETEGDSEQLLQAVQLALSPAVPEELRSDFAFTVRRPSGKRPLTMFARSFTRASAAAGFAPSVVLILILDSSRPKNASISGLRQLYGFTTREAHLANLLTQGTGLAACCDELGISLSTGTSHLKRLFKKTGVHHQSQLVSLLLRSVALAGFESQHELDVPQVHRSVLPQSKEPFTPASSRSGMGLKERESILPESKAGH